MTGKLFFSNNIYKIGILCSLSVILYGYLVRVSVCMWVCVCVCVCVCVGCVCVGGGRVFARKRGFFHLDDKIRVSVMK